jgi:DNA-binding transcriptional LysR family regulator
LNQLENAARSARSASRGEAGSITVGFTSTAIFGPLSQTMREFSRRYPDMQVITRECSIQTLFDSLNEGTIDVACNEECVPNASFDMKEYPAVDVVIALPKAHRFAQEEGPIKLKLLCEETFVLPTQNATWSVYDKFVRALAKAGFHPKHEYWVDSAISGIALVAAGFGICLVPQFAEILHSEVTYRRVTDPDIKITPQLVWKKNRASLPIANLVALVPVPHERTSKKPRKRTPEHTGS